MQLILRSYGEANAWKVPDIDMDKAVLGCTCSLCDSNNGVQCTITAPVAEKNGIAVPGKWFIHGYPILEVHENNGSGYVADVYALFSGIRYTLSKTASQLSTWSGNGTSCRHSLSYTCEYVVANSGQQIYSRCIPNSEFSNNCNITFDSGNGLRNEIRGWTLYTDNVVAIFMPE